MEGKSTAKFQVGQVVWDTEDNVPKVIRTVNFHKNLYWYTFRHEIGVTIPEGLVRKLSEKEMHG